MQLLARVRARKKTKRGGEDAAEWIVEVPHLSKPCTVACWSYSGSGAILVGYLGNASPFRERGTEVIMYGVL